MKNKTGGMALRITMRDYFAAKIMQGLCANPGGPFQANGMSGWGMVNCKEDDLSLIAFAMADSMLKVRNEFQS